MNEEEKNLENQEVQEEKQATSVQQTEEFDWDNYDKEVDDYSSEERQELEKMYDDTMSTIGENEVVDGTVVAITKREVIINIGYKS